jgi:hypothetical protein
MQANHYLFIYIYLLNNLAISWFCSIFSSSSIYIFTTIFAICFILLSIYLMYQCFDYLFYSLLLPFLVSSFIHLHACALEDLSVQ